MVCIAMTVNDYAMPETTRTTGFNAFNVRSDTMRRAKEALVNYVGYVIRVVLYSVKVTCFLFLYISEYLCYTN
jgi:hypothetical protein